MQTGCDDNIWGGDYMDHWIKTVLWVCPIIALVTLIVLISTIL